MLYIINTQAEKVYFALCPVCGKHVRDACFDIAEKEHGGVSMDCSNK
jgi:hypothetical protein